MSAFKLQNIERVNFTTPTGTGGVSMVHTSGGVSVDGFIAATTGVSAGTLRLTSGSITDTGAAISFGSDSLSTTGIVDFSGGVSLSGGVSINGHVYPTSLGTSQFLYYKNATTGVSGYDLLAGSNISLTYGDTGVTITGTGTGGGGTGNVSVEGTFAGVSRIITSASSGTSVQDSGVTIDSSNNITTTGGISAGGGMSAGTLVLNSSSITDTSGLINFGDEDLITTGGLSVLNTVTFYTDTDQGDIIEGSGGLTISSKGTSGTRISSEGLNGIHVTATGGPVSISGPVPIGTIVQGLNFPAGITGTNGQVLQTNGSGTLSFVDNGGGGGTSLSSLSDALNNTTSDNLFLGYKYTPPGPPDVNAKNNIAVGVSALFPAATSEIRGADNIAVGFNALLNGANNAANDHNIAIGSNTLLSPGPNSARNIAIGTSALTELTTGTSNNVAIGYLAGSEITTGYQNTIVGSSAGITTTTGFNNTIIGFGAKSSTSTINNEFTLGNGSVTSLRCADTTITTLSDARDKNDIRDLSYGLNFLENVRPVEFTWDKRVLTPDDENDPKQGKRRAGFIAQELQEAMPDGENDILDLVYESNPQRLEAKYGNLIPVMVKAIQDLKAEVDTLKNHLNLE